MAISEALRASLALIRPTTGLECEALRVRADGQLTDTLHPEIFGNKLHNPYFTTDYAEQQLELITPPLESLRATHERARALAQLAQLEVKTRSELLWPSSMPTILPHEDEIQISRYDDSAAGKAAYAYREHLAERYSKARQMLSGVHFNFSFNEEFMRALYDSQALDLSATSLADFKNKSYMKVARNFNRLSWLFVYLLGASPFYHPSFIRNVEGEIPATCKTSADSRERVCIMEEGISARNGQLGYYNLKPVHPSYASLEDYVASLRKAIDDGILSAAKEFYSPLRLKSHDLENVLDSLEADGIAYIELRLLDINPFDPARISLEDLNLITVLIHYLLICDEPELADNSGARDEENRRLVAQHGRASELKLDDNGKPRLLTEWAEEILASAYECAQLIDDCNDFFEGGASAALASARERVSKPEKTYAARILKLIEEEGFLAGLSRLAKKYQEQAYASRWLTPGFEDWEMSTQLLIAEALKRGVKVSPIDAHDNLILLEKDGKKEYVRQCTKTSKDSYITVLLMENKQVSKRILAEAGLRVPAGQEFKIKDAEAAVTPYLGKPCVIKPKSTNFGIGVVIFDQGASIEQLLAAAQQAATHDELIMIEDFMPGPEYRFLVIGTEAVGVLRRVPAHVTGDGTSSIAELVAAKNEHPYRSTGYRSPLINIQLSEVEEAFIARQGLSFDSVLAQGQTVYLRPNSNISTGGESIDETARTAQVFKDIAVKAAQAFDAHFCGVDIIVEDLEDPESRYGIIEVNFNPAIHIHSFPLHGPEASIAPYVLRELDLIE